MASGILHSIYHQTCSLPYSQRRTTNKEVGRHFIWKNDNFPTENRSFLPNLCVCVCVALFDCPFVMRFQLSSWCRSLVFSAVTVNWERIKKKQTDRAHELLYSTTYDIVVVGGRMQIKKRPFYPSPKGEISYKSFSFVKSFLRLPLKKRRSTADLIILFAHSRKRKRG